MSTFIGLLISGEGCNGLSVGVGGLGTPEIWHKMNENFYGGLINEQNTQ